MANPEMTCVIAEDEILLRDALVALLAEEWPALRIVAACDDGGTALEAIATRQPDVAFLDIRMPGLTGLEVAAGVLEASPATQVVFVTAYDQYAIDAFDKGAVDYLLKPIVRERLQATLQRLQARAGKTRAGDGALAGLLQQLTSALPAAAKSPPLVWLTASSGKDTRLIMVEDIAYFQSDTKYTAVMTADGEALLRKPIRELLDVLDPAIFKQVHRSTIVNMKMVASVTRDEVGRGALRLKSRPETLAVSQPFMALFRTM
ncbi:DNA-binding response regulator [Janthinobacterium sp. BJB1]|uniref:LytR/AlgR family response regulator transcription factor n=1 Tax=Janthinobacterium sp. GW458P TaxID=1981504 RepID=UPI000A329653|nr:LytTR family DNA-binding domain-containing protein [Janthinobacterium sp. GW458P]PHV16946.1 DNA-binding response regulator [Janthinobacterium sp. BJB303]PJC97771.1 DNA-binding response regulator [Janthinobacterium sp. BJB1]